MNLFTRTFSKIFKSSNQQELDKIQNIIEAINNQEKDIKALQGSQTIATALPSCSFFLNIPYSPVKKMLDHNIAIALASDFNPGSTPSGNMQFVNSLA